MHTDVARARTDMSVGQLAEFLQERGIRGAPVLDSNDRLAGVITTWNILKAVKETCSHSGRVVFRRYLRTFIECAY